MGLLCSKFLSALLGLCWKTSLFLTFKVILMDTLSPLCTYLSLFTFVCHIRVSAVYITAHLHSSSSVLLVHEAPRDWLSVWVKVHITASADVVQRRKMATSGSALRDMGCTVTSKRGRRGAGMSSSLSEGLVRNAVFVLSAALLLQVVSGDGKTLVLLDSPNIRDSHSIFFRSLAGDIYCAS